MAASSADAVRLIRQPTLARSVDGGLLLVAVHGRAEPVLVADPGAQVWGLLDTPRTIADVVDAVVARFDGDPDVIEHDVRNLLDALRAEGLVAPA